MKQSIIIGLTSVLLLGFGACSKDGHRCIKGRGDIVSRDFTIQSFDQLSYYGSGNIYITQGPETSMRVEAQDNILNDLDIENRNGELKIGKDNCFRNHKEINIYLTTPTLNRINISGSSNVTGTGTFGGSFFNASISGSGNVNLLIDVDQLVSNISGSGDMYLGGRAIYQDMKISGSGSMHCYGLAGEEADIDISGSGKCEVNVSQKLTVKISGSGDVYYKGNPSINSNISGSGKLIRVN